MKTAVQIGAGNIGRGFMAQIFCDSGYQTIFIDVNQDLIQALETRGSYQIILVDNDNREVKRINRVTGVSGRDAEKAAETVAMAEIVAVSVGTRNLKNVAPTLIAGLRLRWAKQNLTPLNILVCENHLNAPQYLKELMLNKNSVTEEDLFRETVGLVQTSIGRMVPGESEMNGDLLDIRVEPYCSLPVDREGFKGEIPKLMYLKPYSPFDYCIQQKLFIHNFGHAIFAYLGYISGQEYIWEAVEEDDLYKICRYTLNQVALGLMAEHDTDQAEITHHIEDLLKRFHNKALNDTVTRVGRDPYRKLGPEDRIIGAFRLIKRHNLDYTTIPLVIAAALYFRFVEEDGARKGKAREEIERILTEVSRLSTEELKVLAPRVTEYYQMLTINPKEAVNKVVALITSMNDLGNGV